MRADSAAHAPSSSTRQLRRPRWGTVNAEEAISGVMTPLTCSFWFPAIHIATCHAWADLGALSRSEARSARKVDDRFYGVFHGRAAINVDRFRQMADRTPGASGAAVEEQLFGAVSDCSDAPVRRYYPRMLITAPTGVLRARRAARTLGDETPTWRRDAMAELENGGGPHVARTILIESQRRFGAVIRPHIINTMLAQGLFDRVSAFAEAHGLQGRASELVATRQGTEELRVLADLWEVSREQLSLGAFLDRHGFHGPDEAHLPALMWREDPTPITRLLTSYNSLADDDGPARAIQARRAAHRAAREDLLVRQARPRRAATRQLLAIAGEYTELRELGKATFLQVIDVARAATRALGRSLVDDHHLDHAADIAYLTIDEILAPPADSRDLITRRRAEHAYCRTLELPQHWTGEPQPTSRTHPARGHRTVDCCDVISGIGAGVGCAEGVARVVHNPATDDFERGDVLVCHTTDPSWVSLFAIASAVVVDVGGVMSHGAIVARELGLPCVVNTRHGTEFINDRELIRVDGHAGTVTRLGALPAAPHRPGG